MLERAAQIILLLELCLVIPSVNRCSFASVSGYISRWSHLLLSYFTLILEGAA